uniref:Transmembrane protein with EGF-like and two follistatin-like domains 2a n=1 Tax=Electrophorus electricus TaxID=8005 RepID=A0A4W4DU82_ELEEL
HERVNYRLRDWLWIAVVSFIATFPVQQLRAFPSSLSDCQTPTGWNCSGDDDRDTDLFLCDTNTCKFDGECLRIGDIITCICDFKCNNDYVPVCGSNNENYENECLLRRDACKQQTEILVLSEGSCPAGSGSGDEGNEGSAENGQKETSTCDICQFGARAVMWMQRMCGESALQSHRLQHRHWALCSFWVLLIGSFIGCSL